MTPEMGGPAPTRGGAGRFDLAQFLFNAAGRSGRTAFLAAMLGLFVLGALAAFALQHGLPGAVHVAGTWLVGFLVFVVAGVVTSRRLHDLGLAGWWYAPLAGLEFLGETFAAGPPLAFWLSAGPWGVACLGLVFWPGQRRFNRFGPRPG